MSVVKYKTPIQQCLKKGEFIDAQLIYECDGHALLFIRPTGLGCIPCFVIAKKEGSPLDVVDGIYYVNVNEDAFVNIVEPSEFTISMMKIVMELMENVGR